MGHKTGTDSDLLKFGQPSGAIPFARRAAFTPLQHTNLKPGRRFMRQHPWEIEADKSPRSKTAFHEPNGMRQSISVEEICPPHVYAATDWGATQILAIAT
jgi:hypothetical protein